MSKPNICHVEWVTSDPAGLENFLAELFNWPFQTIDPNYMLYRPDDDGISVGILHSTKAQAGGTPNVSIRVADIDSILSKAEKIGGKIAVPKTDIDSGSFAFISAPDGNLIGLQENKG